MTWKSISNAAAQPAGPTIAVSASQQMKDGTAVVDLPNVAGMNARDVYGANGEWIGELAEIVLDDAHRPVAASIETDEGPGGKEHIVGAEKLRLKENSRRPAGPPTSARGSRFSGS